MTKRRNEDAPTGDVTDQLKPLVDDDAFLTELSRGVDPSEGQDELAALLLGLRDDVEKQIPPAPLIEGAEEDPVVISLGEQRRRRRSRPWLSGLLGAAAATLVIAGSGTVLYNATPGSPLWGLSSSLFGDRAAVVELASTLEEMDSRAAEGDMDGTRALLMEARSLLDGMREQGDDRNGENRQDTPGTQAPRTRTTTETVTSTAETPTDGAPVTETTTVTDVATETTTETAVATVTVTQGPPPIRNNPLPNPNPNPIQPPQPTSQPTATAGPTPTLAPPQTQSPTPEAEAEAETGD